MILPGAGTVPDNASDAVLAHSLETQLRLEQAHNYNAWIYELLEPYVHGHVLDVGCSTGNVTSFALRNPAVARVVGLDLSHEAVAYLGQRFREEPRFRAVLGDVLELNLCALPEAPFDSAVCVNVLEHLEDDTGVLRALSRALRPGGHVALFCPALPLLYGSMDLLDGHFRRYTRDGLRRTLLRAGLEPVLTRYVNVVGTFGWFVNGRVLKRKVIPYRQMLAFDRVVPALRRIEGVIEPPFGQSIVAVGKVGHSADAARGDG